MAYFIGIVLSCLAFITTVSAQCQNCNPSGTRSEDLRPNEYRCSCPDTQPNCLDQDRQCVCRMGWTDQYCNTATNFGDYECSTTVCGSWFEGSNVDWVDYNGQWCCQSQGVSGDTINPGQFCNPNPCLQGTCDENSRTCLCYQGYTGQNCESQLFCPSAGCNQPNSYGCDEARRQCNCNADYSGTYCENYNPAPAPEFRCDLNQPACENGGTCDWDINTGLTWCICPPEFGNSPNCAGAVLFCTPGRCLNNGVCNEAQSRCDCVNGYTGNSCEFAPLEECILDNQCNGGTCVNFECVCPQGRFGDNCAYRVGDGCANSFCNNQGTCTYGTEGREECACYDGYTGVTCQYNDPCFFQNRCFNGGTCNGIDSIQFTCNCPPGWTGLTCLTSTDPCNPNPCLNGGECTKISDTTYACACPNNDYVGDTCQTRNWCKSVTCNRRGACINDLFNYRCECEDDFTGPDCETVNYCKDKNCNFRGNCVNDDDDYRCICTEGFKGDDCELTDVCRPNPCGRDDNILLNDGICHEDTTLGVAVCDCPRGWGNFHCESNLGFNDACYDDDFNPKCQNGGVCRSWWNQDVPITNPGSSAYWFTCFCLNGYSGDSCGIAPINACLNNDCASNADCINEGSTFRCECGEGFKGDKCTERDYCQHDNCAAGSTCRSLSDDYICDCPPNTVGRHCDQIDFCALSPSFCENGGTCNNLLSGPSCQCTALWSGSTCSVAKPNACANIICQNGGTCRSVGANGFVCDCRLGYGGARCQLVVPTSFPIFTTRRFFGSTRPGTPGFRPSTPKPTFFPGDGGNNVGPASGDDSSDDGLSTGVIVAIAISGIAILVGLIRLSVYCCQRGRGRKG